MEQKTKKIKTLCRTAHDQKPTKCIRAFIADKLMQQLLWSLCFPSLKRKGKPELLQKHPENHLNNPVLG